MLHGRGAEALLAACDEDFESVFGHAPLTVPQPVKRARKLRGVPAVERAQMRARVAIETMCALPVDPAALVGLMSVLRSHALRHCLPDLPPAAGAPPAQGHWLLGKLRDAASPAQDAAACTALGAALTALLGAAFRAAHFSSSDASHVITVLMVVLAQCSYAPATLAAWDAFMAAIVAAAVATAGAAGLTLPAEASACATEAGKHQLQMVRDEIVETWGMLCLGRWPRAGLIAAPDVAVEVCDALAAAPNDAAVEADGEEVLKATTSVWKKLRTGLLQLTVQHRTCQSPWCPCLEPPYRAFCATSKDLVAKHWRLPEMPNCLPPQKLLLRKGRLKARRTRSRSASVSDK
jgi:hypothetical protein